MSSIRLTQYSHGAGCGCKISPKVLDTILKSQIPGFDDPTLIVGNSSKDDAAVVDIGNGQGIVSTTDFFMPIVDDPFTFGRIAATNAISDIYAMGGKPIVAIAILGWPINTLAPEVAQQVIDGGRQVCHEAGISLAGGHSIDAPEPIFGLAVTGIVPLDAIKQNDTAKVGDVLYLTKPLGIGILTTAQKKGKLKPEHEQLAPEAMCTLNKIGQHFAALPGVHAMWSGADWTWHKPVHRNDEISTEAYLKDLVAWSYRHALAKLTRRQRGSRTQHAMGILHQLADLPAQYQRTWRGYQAAPGAHQQWVTSHLAQPRQRPAHCRRAELQTARRASHTAFGQQCLQGYQQIQIR